MEPSASADKTEILDSPATLIGKTIDGRYLIERNLTDDGADAGGIGVLYLASDQKLVGRSSVVKVLRSIARDNDEIRRKFEHEKEALIKLRHPNIVDIQSIGILPDGNPFVVMEYIPGISLRKKLETEGRLDLKLAADIIRAVSNALAAAHSQGILHRDIKPENVMLSEQNDDSWHVKLIDFGIARIEQAELAPVTTVPGAMGTPKYMAPEQIRGSLAQTGAIDVYALAVLAFEMVTGQLPFVAPNPERLLAMQQAGPVNRASDLRAELSPSVDDMIARALSYEPEDRPVSIREFGQRLGDALEERTLPDTTVAIPPVSQVTAQRRDNLAADIGSPAPVPASVPVKRRSRAPLLVALGLLVAAIVGIPIGMALWNRDEGKPSPNSTAATAVPANSIATDTGRALKYYLEVQKMVNGQAVGQSFRSTGGEIYQNGQKFRMSLTAPADGFLYVFAEGQDAKGAQTFSIIFPTPRTNSGSPAVTRDQTVETGTNTFGGAASEEILWAIWTKDQNSDLEAARTSAFANTGEVDSANGSKLKEFLDKAPASKKEDVKADPDKTETTVKTQGDAVVHKIVLQHK